MRTFMGSRILVSLLSTSFVFFSSCTRSEPENSKVTVTLPAFVSTPSAKKLAPPQSMSVGAQSTETRWGLPLPASATEINCFAIAYTVPELSQPVTCRTLGGAEDDITDILGVFPAGSEATIDVPSGPNRVIYLVGIKADNPALCVNLGAAGGVLPAAHFSPPVILDKISVDLPPGDVKVSLSIKSDADYGNVFEDCDNKPLANPTAIEALATGHPEVATNAANVTATVKGYNVSTYQYDITSDLDCSSASYNATPIPVTVGINHDISSYNDVDLALCLKANTQTTPTIYKFKKDTSDPSVVGPLVGTATSSSLFSTPKFSWNAATDSGSGIKEYELTVAESDMTVVTSVKVDAKYGTAHSVPLVLPLVAGNLYRMMVKAYDHAGNASTAQMTYWTVKYNPAWSLHTFAKASNAGADDHYGRGIAVEGDVMVVSASYEDGKNPGVMNGTVSDITNDVNESGAVYVYKRSSGVWAQTAYIKAPAPYYNDRFGTSVAISGNTIVVGAHGESSATNRTITGPAGDDTSNSGYLVGAAYVFEYDGTNWAQTAYLKAPNAVAAQDLFGHSVAIHKDTIVVGSIFENSSATGPRATPPANSGATQVGAAYVFNRNAVSGLWEYKYYLKPSALDPAKDMRFGAAVAVQDDTIIVGAPHNDSSYRGIINGSGSDSNWSAENAGAVYVFKNTGGYWRQQAFIKPSNPDAGDTFGNAVAFSNDTLVVGATNQGSGTGGIRNGTPAPPATNDLPNSGAVYVFKRTGNSWAETAFIKPSVPGKDEYFGYGLSISGSTIAVGAHGESSCVSTGTSYAIAPPVATDDTCVFGGAAFTFSVNSSGDWEEQAFFKNGGKQSFGSSLVLSDGDLFVAAPYNDSTQNTFSSTIGAPSHDEANVGAIFIYKIVP